MTSPVIHKLPRGSGLRGRAARRRKQELSPPKSEARQRRQRQSAADNEGERADSFAAETSPALLPSLIPTPLTVRRTR